MTDRPLITIATVTYNAEATLERTLESVARQTYRPVEHLIVDGCSTDRTISLVRHYIEHNADPRRLIIRVVREPDAGLYDAMNKALRLATGDYIVFLNAGDTLHADDTLQTVVQASAWRRGGLNPAVIYGQTDIVDNQGHFLHPRHLVAPDQLRKDSYLDGMLVCHQSLYVRTDIARAFPYDLRYRFSADYDWSIRILERAERRRLPVVNAQCVLTDYLNEGMTTRNHRQSLLERLRIMARHFGWTRTLARHAWFVFRALRRS